MATLLNLPTGVTLVALVVKLSYFATGPAFPFVVCFFPMMVQQILLMFGNWTFRMVDYVGEDYGVERFVTTIVAALWFVGILFIALQLDGFVDWSWYTVFAPVWAMWVRSVLL